MITGIPARTAASMDGRSASGLAIDTTSPPVCCATALSISFACAPGSPSDVYSTCTPRSLPACSAPFFTTFQNASPAVPWVITETFSGPDGVGAAAGAVVFGSAAGPVHAASSKPAASRLATARPERRARSQRWDIVVSPRLFSELVSGVSR